MNSNTRKNSMVTHRVISEGVVGFTVIGQAEIQFDLTKAAQTNRIRAEMHGWIQRITDLAALPTEDKDGNLIPRTERLATMHSRMSAVVDHYQSGAEEWSRKSTAGPRVETDHLLIVEAIGLLYNMTYPEVQKFVSEKATNLNVSRAAVMDNFAASPRVAEKMASIRAERVAAAGITEESLFAGLPTE